ncbi:FtsX-like permease family protein [uncultured Cohaesibacter sp.]|uniref:ABC transporter permease n=1 Tax=uncultured Cohaesibacter sp. TaxID=1002546 RepID=UPI0029C65283|nr:FtsX-like permease family protein [uncultured Cohaesibacter sp.]
MTPGSTSLFRRHLGLIDFCLAASRRRLSRNLILLGVYALVIFLLASVMFFSHAIRREAAVLLDEAPEITVQRLVMGRHDLVPMSYLDRLGKIRGVQTIEGRLWGYFYDRGTGANYTLMVPASDRPGLSLDPGQTIVGEGVARLKGLVEGRFLPLTSPTGKPMVLRIKDILDAHSALVSSDLVLVSEADFRRFFDLPDDVYTDLVLSVRNPREVATVVGKASYKLPDARFVTREDILKTYEAIFSWREGLMLALLGTSLLAFAIFVFDKASGLSGEEKREIGILKAVGWDTGDILAMKFWEGALMSLMAFLLGTLAAYAHVFFLDAGLLKPVLQGWGVLYPTFSLTPAVDGLQLATLAFFTIVPFTAATIVPIWRAAITDPEQVMR